MSSLETLPAFTNHPSGTLLHWMGTKMWNLLRRGVPRRVWRTRWLSVHSQGELSTGGRAKLPKGPGRIGQLVLMENTFLDENINVLFWHYSVTKLQSKNVARFRSKTVKKYRHLLANRWKLTFVLEMPQASTLYCHSGAKTKLPISRTAPVSPGSKTGLPTSSTPGMPIGASSSVWERAQTELHSGAKAKLSIRSETAVPECAETAMSKCATPELQSGP